MDGPIADRRRQTAARLRQLLDALESGDDAAFEQGIDALAREREDALFARVARLTRELHDAVVELRVDERLARIAGDEIPDARHRLDYVMQMTEQAAHRTLDLVEQARGVAVGIDAAAAHVAEAESVIADNHPDIGNVAVLLQGIGDDLRGRSDALRGTLSELAQAQEYQDISGQIIKRVIALVCNVETALLELLRSAGGGGALQTAPAAPIQAKAGDLAGPAVPGAVAASQQDADELLASLGF
ncbi:MAG: protein phosphatase CheZ [Sinimarinibacterium flocculans]|uniref:protein phosphatase CheZ n=1 Tax=Sinimarinibacterium flocculans TaxID=985250 RepID=UPI002E9FD0BE|nr:protein phosphatase CheZ [Pseudomonadota bacterium]